MNFPFFLIFLSILFNFCAAETKKDTWVSGYTKKNGTYVSGHYRSAPDKSFSNNWSTKGNVNPYTGEEGTKTDITIGHGTNLDYQFTGANDNFNGPSNSTQDESDESIQLKLRIKNLELENSELKIIKSRYDALMNENSNAETEKAILNSLEKSTIKPLSRVQPKYSIDERLNGAQGLAILKIITNQTGEISHLDLVKSTGYSSLDSKTIEAVSKWIYPKQAGLDYAIVRWKLVGEPYRPTTLRRSILIKSN